MPVIEQLSSDYHCFAPDLLGFGESESPNIHYSIEVECLAEWVKALKLPKVYLVAHSLGGWVAASFALKYSEQVAGLVLLGSEGVQIREKGDRWSSSRLLLTPWIEWALRSLLPLSKFFKFRAIERLLHQRRQLLESLPACNLLFYRRRSEVRAEYLNDRLRWLKIPVLVLQGQQDDSISASLNQAYTQLTPKAKLEQIPQAGEDILATHPDQVAERIQEFIAVTGKG
jgi:pimeloyl-ACP methyl ester carboxylesterase